MSARAEMNVAVAERAYRLESAFTISRESRHVARVLEVSVERDGIAGRGECVPQARYGESLETVATAIRELALPFDREELQDLLPAGAARNAVDCALWDLEARQAGRRVWELAGLSEPETLTTAYTLSLDSPERMKASAERAAAYPVLKVKLGRGMGDAERLRAVREGAPDSRIVADANEGWNADEFRSLLDLFAELDVEMVEQPFAAGEDRLLETYSGPVAICADESCHDRRSLDSLPAGYRMINIKLDKTGGLTEALALRQAARERGYDIMVGCMVGSSLAMAPATLVAQGAELADLDGPLLLESDCPHGLRYEGGCLHPPEAELWG